jgi:tRNA (guanine-N7-)-methyltransferase
MTIASRPLRPIRSFVRRESRMTASQKCALKELWPRYGVGAGAGPLDFDAVFGRQAPVILEIGFGNGDALQASAVENPQNNYLGIEVHRPGIGTLLRNLDASGIENVRVMHADAAEVLMTTIPNDSLTAVRLFFPDPWPKKRHHKRRLVQPEFAELMWHKLKPGGYFHLATDWEDYAAHMRAVLLQTPGFVEVTGQKHFSSLSHGRPPTKFELRGRRLGHGVQDLIFERLGAQRS